MAPETPKLPWRVEWDKKSPQEIQKILEDQQRTGAKFYRDNLPLLGGGTRVSGGAGAARPSFVASGGPSWGPAWGPGGLPPAPKEPPRTLKPLDTTGRIPRPPDAGPYWTGGVLPLPGHSGGWGPYIGPKGPARTRGNQMEPDDTGGLSAHVKMLRKRYGLD